MAQNQLACHVYFLQNGIERAFKITVGGCLLPEFTDLAHGLGVRHTVDVPTD